jgi:hypothetical protein
MTAARSVCCEGAPLPAAHSLSSCTLRVCAASCLAAMCRLRGDCYCSLRAARLRGIHALPHRAHAHALRACPSKAAASAARIPLRFCRPCFGVIASSWFRSSPRSSARGLHCGFGCTSAARLKAKASPGATAWARANALRVRKGSLLSFEASAVLAASRPSLLAQVRWARCARYAPP